MFWKKRVEEEEYSRFFDYCQNRIIPNFNENKAYDSVLDTAQKNFGSLKGWRTSLIEESALDFGRSLAMIMALAFGQTFKGATDQSTSDIELFDCYMCALFCLLHIIKDDEQAIEKAFSHFGPQLELDAHYLTPEGKDTIEDLTETGWERYLDYYDNPDAKFPAAYIHLLAEAIHHRRLGFPDPYSGINPMNILPPLLFVKLETCWNNEVRKLVNGFLSMISTLQDLAEEKGDEFWPDCNLTYYE